MLWWMSQPHEVLSHDVLSPAPLSCVTGPNGFLDSRLFPSVPHWTHVYITCVSTLVLYQRGSSHRTPHSYFKILFHFVDSKWNPKAGNESDAHKKYIIDFFGPRQSLDELFWVPDEADCARKQAGSNNTKTVRKLSLKRHKQIRIALFVCVLLQRIKLTRNSALKLPHASVTFGLLWFNVGNMFDEFFEKLLSKNAAAIVLTGNGKTDDISPILASLQWLPIQFRLKYSSLLQGP